MKVLVILILAILGYYAFTAVGELIVWLLSCFLDNFFLASLGLIAVVGLISKK